MSSTKPTLLQQVSVRVPLEVVAQLDALLPWLRSQPFLALADRTTLLRQAIEEGIKVIQKQAVEARLQHYSSEPQHMAAPETVPNPEEEFVDDKEWGKVAYPDDPGEDHPSVEPLP